MSCRVPDLGLLFVTRLGPDGADPVEEAAPGSPPAQVRFTANSDDLVAIASDPASFARAWLTGRLRVEAERLRPAQAQEVPVTPGRAPAPGSIARPPDRHDFAPRRSEVGRVPGVDARLDERVGDLAGPLGRQAQPPPGDVGELVEAPVVRPAGAAPSPAARPQAHRGQDAQQVSGGGAVRPPQAVELQPKLVERDQRVRGGHLGDHQPGGVRAERRHEGRHVWHVVKHVMAGQDVGRRDLGGGVRPAAVHAPGADAAGGGTARRAGRASRRRCPPRSGRWPGRAAEGWRLRPPRRRPGRLPAGPAPPRPARRRGPTARRPAGRHDGRTPAAAAPRGIRWPPR